MEFTDVLSRLEGVTGSNNQFYARCPAHDDRTASLSISEGEGGKPLLYCHAGCSFEKIIAALEPSVVRSAAKTHTYPTAAKKIVATYDYRDENGALLFQKVRYDPKSFSIRQPQKGGNGWINNRNGVKLIPYNLQTLISSDDIYIVEGEKDVDTLRKMNIAACCSPDGAGASSKFKPELVQWFAGKSVFIIPDNDEAGKAFAQDEARILASVAKSVKILDLLNICPKLPEHGDITDVIQALSLTAEQTAEALKNLVESTPDYNNDNTHQPRNQYSKGFVEERDIGEIKTKPWPVPIGKAAYYGLTGQVINSIRPYSEADDAALLITWLVMAGNILHRQPFFPVGADRHYINLNACIVGQSSKGRKGMSANFIKDLLEKIDALWAKDKITSGLSSGEGLIYAVRDQVIEQKPIREKGQKGQKGPITGYEDEVVDKGVTDKRLMVVEGEFAQCLQVMSREGNTLSPVIRQAWDTGRLNTLVKTSKNKATGAHISIIGHITEYEIKRLLNQNEMLNGFGNRFLWVLSKRSKYLPDGAIVPQNIINHLVSQIFKVYEFAGLHKEFNFDDEIIIDTIDEARAAARIAFIDVEMQRDSEANKKWAEIYRSLSTPRPGLGGAVINRGEAQVLRLSMIYALLDLSYTITVDHLNAALAVWEYCEESAKYIFGDMGGNQVAQEIMIALEAKGEMTQNDIVNLFNRNKPASQIKEALQELLERGTIEQRKDKSKPGRPTTIWSINK